MNRTSRRTWCRAAGILLCAVWSLASCTPARAQEEAPNRKAGDLATSFAPSGKPKTVLWAVPGELRIDPLTGKPMNPDVRGREWPKQNSVWSGNVRTVRLAGARNEWLGFQLIVEAAGDNLKYVQVRVSELTGPGGQKIPANNYRLYRVWYTEVTEPSRMLQGFNAMGLPSLGTGWYGSALIPLRIRRWGAPFAVPRG